MCFYSEANQMFSLLSGAAWPLQEGVTHLPGVNTQATHHMVTDTQVHHLTFK